MKKTFSVLLCLVLLCGLLLPAAHAEDAPLVECALKKLTGTYVRFTEAVVGVADDFSAEGVAHDDWFRVTIDPAMIEIIERERLEFVYLDGDIEIRDESQYRGTSDFGLVLHGLLLADGTRTDVTIDRLDFEPYSGKYLTTNAKNRLYSETWNSKNRCYDYDVAVGSVWTLEEANDEYVDDYLYAHTEILFEGAAPDVQGNTYTFNTPGDYVYNVRCCGGFNVKKGVIHVHTKSKMKRMLILPLIVEGFEAGMAVGFWLGPWWLPISFPLGALHTLANLFLVLIA